MDDIAIEMFIEHIKTRPEIWNITSEEYKDKKKRDESWEDICHHLVEEFSDMEEKEKKEYGKIFYLLVHNIFYFYILIFLNIISLLLLVTMIVHNMYLINYLYYMRLSCHRHHFQNSLRIHFKLDSLEAHYLLEFVSYHYFYPV